MRRAAVVVAGWLFLLAAPTPALAPAGVYHADPLHLWDRLHDALFVRIGAGAEFGRDRVEPLLWGTTKHLLHGASHDRLVSTLDEFLKTHGERLVADPLKRAMLQRDLWQVFSWLEHERGGFSGYGDTPEQWRAAQVRLRERLAPAMARLALTARQIGSLRSNYDAAVRSGAFAPAFDPAQPERLYLPPDLFAPDGSWVAVGRRGELPATHHVTGDNPFTTSAFLVFLRLPGGRAATLDYLQRLEASPELPAVGTGRSFGGSEHFEPNPRFPQFPEGTQTALVRMALLVSSGPEIVASPIVELVQLRTYRRIPAITAEIIMTAELRRQSEPWQHEQELTMSRARLFAGMAGGLGEPSDDEIRFRTGFATHGVDAFEGPLNGSGGPWPRPYEDKPLPRATAGCASCHRYPGVHSFNAYVPFHGPATARRRPPFQHVPLAEGIAAGVKWKQAQEDWTLLKRLLGS